MEKVYEYCNRCGKPIDTEHKSTESDNALEFCSACAAELLKKIYGKEQ